MPTERLSWSGTLVNGLWDVSAELENSRTGDIPVIVQLSIGPGPNHRPGDTAIDSQVLRGISVRRIRAAVLAAEGVDLEAAERRLRTPPQPKNKVRQDTFYLWIASLVLQAQERGEQPYRAIRSALERNGWALPSDTGERYTRIRDMVSQATKRGFLAPGRPGKAPRRAGERFAEGAKVVGGRTLDVNPEIPIGHVEAREYRRRKAAGRKNSTSKGRKR